MEGLKKYYVQLEQDCERVNNLYILNPDSINNPGIYNLLTSKYHEATEKGIDVNIYFLLDLNDLHMKIYEFARILGILLDNAIEASIKEEESKRYINVRAKVIKSFLTISVENNTVEGEEIDFVSRKDDQENHGFGMKNIKNVINKYGGEMTFETNNSCISIFVMLNKV